jgi:hypothetical protein
MVRLAGPASQGSARTGIRRPPSGANAAWKAKLRKQRTGPFEWHGYTHTFRAQRGAQRLLKAGFWSEMRPIVGKLMMKKPYEIRGKS